MERLLVSNDLVPDNEVWVSPNTFAKPFSNLDTVEIKKPVRSKLPAQQRQHSICRNCGGYGKKRAGFAGFRKCKKCGGTGKQNA